VLAQHAGTLGDLVGIGRDHAGVARGAEILGGIKTEGGYVAQSSGLYSLPLRAPGLGGVFDELQPTLFCDPGEGGPVGGLAEEMDRQNGAESCGRRSIENFFNGKRIEVESRRFDVGQ
jgi:hypothetical protein